MNIVMIGAGNIGKALAHAIGANAQVDFWDADVAKVPNQRSLEELLPRADVVCICTPSWVVRQVSDQIRDMIPTNAIVMTPSKGIEPETLKTMDMVLEESFSPRPTAVLGGPLLSEEILQNLPSVGVVGCKDESWFERIEHLFDGSSLRIEYVSDPKTVAVASVLKNIYAMGLGIAEGLGWGWNGKGWLASLAISEMREMVHELDGDGNVFFDAAGVGDFLATAMSERSRNREAGRRLVETGVCDGTNEGCKALPLVKQLIGDRAYPFFNAIDQIVLQHGNPAQIYQALLHFPL